MADTEVTPRAFVMVEESGDMLILTPAVEEGTPKDHPVAEVAHYLCTLFERDQAKRGVESIDLSKETEH